MNNSSLSCRFSISSNHNSSSSTSHNPNLRLRRRCSPLPMAAGYSPHCSIRLRHCSRMRRRHWSIHPCSLSSPQRRLFLCRPRSFSCRRCPRFLEFRPTRRRSPPRLDRSTTRRHTARHMLHLQRRGCRFSRPGSWQTSAQACLRSCCLRPLAPSTWPQALLSRSDSRSLCRAL